jgi:hypothetical protein
MHLDMFLVSCPFPSRFPVYSSSYQLVNTGRIDLRFTECLFEFLYVQSWSILCLHFVERWDSVISFFARSVFLFVCGWVDRWIDEWMQRKEK